MAKGNGAIPKRKLESWIDAFVEYTDNLEAAPAFRRWAAITAIAATLEQKVWLQTSAPLYPNLYIFLVGHPGVGKTRTINAASTFLRELPEFHLSPTSMSAASLVDALMESKRTIVRLPEPPAEYNSMTIMADELSAFMHSYDNEMVGNLTTFYDVVVPYGQQRRGKDIRIKIKSPQLSILTGTTPSNLLKLLPENAWEQGFTSRVIMVFSDQRIITDIFAYQKRSLPEDMLHDLKIINSLYGGFKVTQDYKDAINAWRETGQAPAPTHPRLIHYSTRRLAHLFKLSMVSAIDRTDALILTKDDYSRALNWLLSAERDMPEVFKAGATSLDSKAMDDIHHHVMVSDTGVGVAEPAIVRRARELLPAMSVDRVLEVMIRAEMIKVSKVVKGVRYFKATQSKDAS